MRHAVVLAGFGGQGVLLAGKLLAYAAMEEGRHVSWLPSYGPEMRGGTANCTVVLADDRIGSPVVDRPDAALVMNRPSYRKFLSKVGPGGLVVVNASLVPDAPERDDVRSLHLPATDLAVEIGSARVANLVLLGAYLERARVVSVDAVSAALDDAFGGKPDLAALNRRALDRGVAAARSAGGTEGAARG